MPLVEGKPARLPLARSSSAAAALEIRRAPAAAAFTAYTANAPPGDARRTNGGVPFGDALGSVIADKLTASVAPPKSSLILSVTNVWLSTGTAPSVNGVAERCSKPPSVHTTTATCDPGDPVTGMTASSGFFAAPLWGMKGVFAPRPIYADENTSITTQGCGAM